MSVMHRVVPTLTEVVDEAVLEGRELRSALPSQGAQARLAATQSLAPARPQDLNLNLDSRLPDLPDPPGVTGLASPQLRTDDSLEGQRDGWPEPPLAQQFLAELPRLSLDLPDLSLQLQEAVQAQAPGLASAEFPDLELAQDLLADTRAPEQDMAEQDLHLRGDGPSQRLAALPAAQELAMERAIDQAVDDALDEVLDQVLESAVMALRAQLHRSVKAAVLRRLHERARTAL